MVGEGHNIIMVLLGEIKDVFHKSVKSYDKEACEDVGILEFDSCECGYNMSIGMEKANRKDDAEEYFDDALSLEKCLRIL